MSEATVTEQASIDAQIEALRLELDALGIEYHHKHGVEKLRELYLKAINNAAGSPSAEPAEPVEDPLELLRVIVTCNDPNKREYTGDYFTSGNEVIGLHTKYIPFANEKGWHVPRVIINMMREARVQLFKKTKDSKTGMEISTGYTVPMFTIEVLPNLTKKELEDLALMQARSGSLE